MKFSIKAFFSNCDQIRMKLRILSHILKKSLTENFIFYAMVLLCNTEICYSVLIQEFLSKGHGY